MFKICNSFLKRCVLCCVYMYLFIDLKAELILQINLAMIHQCFDICFSCHDIVCCDHTDLFFTHYKSFIFSHGARSVTLSKLVPMICKLLDDQNGQVRFMFFNIIKTTRLWCRFEFFRMTIYHSFWKLKISTLTLHIW